jgi:hypothetical protein
MYNIIWSLFCFSESLKTWKKIFTLSSKVHLYFSKNSKHKVLSISSVTVTYREHLCHVLLLQSLLLVPYLWVQGQLRYVAQFATWISKQQQCLRTKVVLILLVFFSACLGKLQCHRYSLLQAQQCVAVKYSGFCYTWLLWKKGYSVSLHWRR